MTWESRVTVSTSLEFVGVALTGAARRAASRRDTLRSQSGFVVGAPRMKEHFIVVSSPQRQRKH